MRLPDSAHTERSWRIHELAFDFDLVDVWALPTPGGPDDFPRLVELATSLDLEQSASPLVRVLFGVRKKLGEALGWDDEKFGIGARVASLRDRLPADLRELPLPEFSLLPAEPVYRTENEFAAEVANKTVHGVLHFGWVEDDEVGYRGQMAILVRTNGVFGRAYLTMITPFRYLFVYPAAMRDIAQRWREMQSLRLAVGE